jgi:hypothetical protein
MYKKSMGELAKVQPLSLEKTKTSHLPGQPKKSNVAQPLARSEKTKVSQPSGQLKKVNELQALGSARKVRVSFIHRRKKVPQIIKPNTNLSYG